MLISELDCVNNGHWEYCDDGQKGCFIEERKRRQHRGEAREVESVYTGCKQLNACIVLFNVRLSYSSLELFKTRLEIQVRPIEVF